MNATIEQKRRAVATRTCECGARAGTQCKKITPRITGRQALLRLPVSQTHASRTA